MYPPKINVFILLVMVTQFVLAQASVRASGTLAGTTISNQAQVDYVDGLGNTGTDISNTVLLRVDEILDVSLTRNDANDVPVQTAAIAQSLSYRLTNKGNGTEQFSLVANAIVAGDQFDPATIRIAIDSNGNGIYDPSIDQLYASGQNDPLLTPDQSIIIFTLGDMPASLTNGDRSFVDLTATAIKGSGSPGTIFPNLGIGGGNAIVGSTTASAIAQSIFVAAMVDVQLMKSLAILDPAGGTTPISGSIVTYTITARLTGTGQVSNAAINDPIPGYTTYVPGSLKINNASLTDSADTDSGQVNNSVVTVALGTLTAPATNTISFQVKLN
jgi:uncharacterized repeat protein (TIGR01451 family)